mmetsp:Transcript_41800/g.87740  ORF Transcript_41800/g.87740 Transcript_41800/m.87740 type:complete len:230 (+) Transcript_41800:382-1071(+)
MATRGKQQLYPSPKSIFTIRTLPKTRRNRGRANTALPLPLPPRNHSRTLPSLPPAAQVLPRNVPTKSPTTRGRMIRRHRNRRNRHNNDRKNSIPTSHPRSKKRRCSWPTNKSASRKYWNRPSSRKALPTRGSPRPTPRTNPPSGPRSSPRGNRRDVLRGIRRAIPRGFPRIVRRRNPSCRNGCSDWNRTRLPRTNRRRRRRDDRRTRHREGQRCPPSSPRNVRSRYSSP